MFVEEGRVEIMADFIIVEFKREKIIFQNDLAVTDFKNCFGIVQNKITSKTAKNFK